MSAIASPNLVGKFGYYGPDPGNNLSPLQVLHQFGQDMKIFSPYKLGGLELDMPVCDFMTVDDMEASTLAILAGDDEYKNRLLEDRIRSMANMQRYLLAELEKALQGSAKDSATPTVVVRMFGSAIHQVLTNQPARVVLLDQDTENADDANIRSVGGETIYLHDLHITNNLDGATGVLDPDSVKAVVSELDQPA